MKRYKVYCLEYNEDFDLYFNTMQNDIEKAGEHIDSIQIDQGKVYVVTSIGFKPGEKVEK